MLQLATYRIDADKSFKYSDKIDLQCSTCATTTCNIFRCYQFVRIFGQTRPPKLSMCCRRCLLNGSGSFSRKTVSIIHSVATIYYLCILLKDHLKWTKQISDFQSRLESVWFMNGKNCDIELIFKICFLQFIEWWWILLLIKVD